MKVRLTPEGAQRFRIVNDWWLANGDHVPELFAEEVIHVLDLLPDNPSMGSDYKTDRFGVIRRVLLPKTQQYLYYSVHHDEDVIEVMSFWGARRGERPPL